MESGVKDFYSGKTLFVTGATGFLGKTLIEKLLRTCDGIQKIYILIRKKRSKSAQQRAQEYCSDPIFSYNGLNETDNCRKVEPIFGDILSPDLGISCEDRQRLIEEVNVVLHLAATVKLNAPLKPSIQRNLRPIIPIIDLCHQIERLDCLVYVSTAATLIGTGSASEVVTNNSAVSPEFVIKACDDLNLKDQKKMTRFLFNNYLNNYCISKALCEQALLRESHRMNIAIIRPSAILPAYKEPVPGWVQGKQIVSTALLVGLGIMQVMPPVRRGTQCFIPVDFVANSIIVSACYVANQRSPKLQVYNVTSISKWGISLDQILENIKNYSKVLPSKRMVRCPHLTMASTHLEFKLKNFYRHFVFAYLIDFIAKLIGREPRLVRTIYNMDKNYRDIQAFINASPQYEVYNTLALIEQMSESDRKEFDFDVRNIEWNEFCKLIWLGIRRYMLREKDGNLTYARIKYQRLVYRTFMINSVLIIISILFIIMFYHFVF